jgi:hypothetical protein
MFFFIFISQQYALNVEIVNWRTLVTFIHDELAGALESADRRFAGIHSMHVGNMV